MAEPGTPQDGISSKPPTSQVKQGMVTRARSNPAAHGISSTSSQHERHQEASPGSSRPSPTTNHPGPAQDLPLRSIRTSDPNEAATESQFIDDSSGYDDSWPTHPGTPGSQSLPSVSVTSSPADGRVDLQHMQGGDPPAAEAHIRESDSELMAPRTPRDSQDSVGRAEAVLASIKGLGLPTLEDGRHRHPGSLTEITDGGDQLYMDLKKEGRTGSFPIKYTSEETTLADRLFDSLSTTYSPNPSLQSQNGILPKGQLDSLINEEFVEKELLGCLGDMHSRQNIRKYARLICRETILTGKGSKVKVKTFKKVFAILVLIDKTSTIPRFLDEDLSDLDLPLQKHPLDSARRVSQLRRKNNPDQHLSCFNGWKQISLWNFEQWQWSFLSPFFADGRKKAPNHYTLRKQDILPFLYIADSTGLDPHDREEFHGGQSDVFKVHIHPEHHGFHDPKIEQPRFAIRRLHSRNRGEFEKELSILKKFSGDWHKNVISLLASYEQFDQYFLIFRWAESDLHKFWVNNPVPEISKESVVWMATQCAGIADGLQRIHTYRDSLDRLQDTHEPLFGRHGDIKPENILLFRNSDDPTDRGTLKLADFGLADFRSKNSRSKVPRSQIGNTMEYRPPECDTPQKTTISRSYDIWTLGCVYLEFMTWAIGGFNLRSRFTRQRLSRDLLMKDISVPTFFELENGTVPRVKPVVTKHFQRLHAHESCTQFFHDFLNMIEQDMLIVELEHPHERLRIPSCDVVQQLKSMLYDCIHVSGYADQPAILREKKSRVMATRDGG